MQIAAAVARQSGAPFMIEELELDALRHNEVRVRMVATGICHTDTLVRDGIYPTPLPAVLGHEGAGMVEAVGDSVVSVVPGDHVVLAAAYCGHCKRCRNGQMAYCENLMAADFGGRRPDGATSLSKDDEVISSHFFGQSSFATYANVVEESIVRVDKDIPLEHLGPLGCGINTGAGTVLNELKPEIGSSLVVFGTGAVGCAAVMAARVADCSTIIAVDIHDSRLELARELGATHVINSKTENVAERLVLQSRLESRFIVGRHQEFAFQEALEPHMGPHRAGPPQALIVPLARPREKRPDRRRRLQIQRGQRRGHRRIRHPTVEARQRTRLVSHVRGHRSQTAGNVHGCHLN